MTGTWAESEEDDVMSPSPSVMRKWGGRSLAAVLFAAALPALAAAQAHVVLTGRILDGGDGTPVAGASVTLLPASGAAAWQTRITTSDSRGEYRFADLPRGRYSLSVERLAYGAVTLEVTLERDAPLYVSVHMTPDPFRLEALTPRNSPAALPSLVVPSPGVSGGGEVESRAAAVRARQERFLSHDVRQLSHADLREANTLAEDDILRAFQRGPGVTTRDDFSAELWTRGAAAGQTVLLFDDIAIMGGLHALGIFSGVNSDMLSAARFEPGVSGAALQGGGAGVISVESRSRLRDGHSGTAALSPASARFATDGRLSERIAWAIGARRSYIDVLSSIANDLTPGPGRLPYAFADMTARVDVALAGPARIEASGFWQDDGISGDVPEVAYGNAGNWGALVARTSVIVPVGRALMRHTLGVSSFDASVRITDTALERSPLHPSTENHSRALVWESRIDGADADAPWSVGIRATRERHAYNGPGIDLARLLSAEEFARRGITELTPVILDIERARLLTQDRTTRIALWGEQRRPLSDALDIAYGLRVETGDRVRSSSARLAPRLQLRYRAPLSPLSLSAAIGRSWQYTQSIARTDVLRTGLRASEVIVQADEDSPALRSDIATLGAELWQGSSWLFGANAWVRASDGILIPLPAPGAIDGPRAPVSAHGNAHGVELSARRLEGRVRGFANYSLSWSRHRVGTRSFAASEDRRHVANLGVVGDVRPSLQLGATWRLGSGAPYTRITVLDTGCNATLGCDGATVLYGTASGQRAGAYASLDLMTEWTREYASWSLSVYGQLRNALGSANAVTYHSSCVCLAGGSDGARLGDRFDRGLPRLPIVGMRVRF